MSVVFGNYVVTLDRNRHTIYVAPTPDPLPERMIGTPSSFGNGDDVWLFLKHTPGNRHQLGSFAPAISWLCKHLNLIPRTNMHLNVIETNSVVNTLSNKFLLLNELRKQFKPSIGGNILDQWFAEPLTDAFAVADRRGKVAYLLSRGEPFVRWLREELKQCVLPAEIRSLSNCVAAKQFVERVLSINANGEFGIPVPRDWAQRVATLLTDTAEGSHPTALVRNGTEDLDERRTQLENQFEFLRLDLRRQLGHPGVELSDQGFVVPRELQRSLSKVGGIPVKITKSSVTFTTAAFNDHKLLYDAHIEEEREFANEIFETLLPIPEFPTTALAELDACAAMAWFVLEQQTAFCEPVVGNSIDLVNAHHPLISDCIPNNYSFGNGCSIINGWNSAGKSTAMRTVATCVFFHQIGMLVPAGKATLPIFDKIRARAGTSDALTQQNSTFQTQMLEVAAILREATPRSLVCLDEVGSATNAEQGQKIAVAIARHLNDIGATTLVTTHFRVEDFNLPAFSVSQEHKIVPFDPALASNGWEFCKARNYIK